MRVLVLLSGGQDSTTVLFRALDDGHEVYALTINYGQRHAIEIGAAARVYEEALKHYRPLLLGHEILHIGSILESSSPLVSDNELEQYADHQSLPGGIERTFVPLRNQLFLTIAANRAVAHQCESIHLGVSQEDYGGYPDCRIPFLIAIGDAIDAGLEGVAKVDIEAPLVQMTKADTVRMAASMRGCWEALAFTHTAYDGGYPPVSHDHASLLRAKGFEEAGLPDPLVVRAARENLMPLPHTPNYDDVNRELQQETRVE